MTDTSNLRALAERATQDGWSVVDGCRSHGPYIENKATGETVCDFYFIPRIGGRRDEPVSFENADANAAYIAACDPQTIIALVDRNSALEKVAEAAKALQKRLDEHYCNPNGEKDWLEQSQLRAALAALEQKP